MKDMIETLSKEYVELHHKLNGVAALIKVYGGILPHIPGHHYSGDVIEATMGAILSYPSDDTWKEKIKFVLGELGKPSTVGEIFDVVKVYDTIRTETQIINALTQTCSAMAVKGILGVEKGYKNKYYVK